MLTKAMSKSHEPPKSGGTLHRLQKCVQCLQTPPSGGLLVIEKQEILGLHVSMKNAIAMHVIQTFQDLLGSRGVSKEWSHGVREVGLLRPARLPTLQFMINAKQQFQ